MLYFFKLILVLINIDQEMVLNWFKISTPPIQNVLGQNIEVESSIPISFETFRLITNNLWLRVQDGLTLTDIEGILFFILVLRFLILAIKYNLKTSFYITIIGLFAGYLWYKHLIDIITVYRAALLNFPYLQKLGVDSIELDELNRQIFLTDLRVGNDVHWYNPGKLIYSAFINGIMTKEPETQVSHYIDPLSMYIGNLNESKKSFIIPYYYKLYNKIIPQIFSIISKFCTQISNVIAYSLITRIGKRYCPYLIRWHWTFLLLINFIEQIFIYFVNRALYFQTFVLIPKAELASDVASEGISLIAQINLINGLLAVVVSVHIAFILFGLFHAIWGQYFYIPFLTENAELHIGPRLKSSIYSGGYTAWQDEKKLNIHRVFPKIWYGWFGKGTKKPPLILRPLYTTLTNFKLFIEEQLRKIFLF